MQITRMKVALLAAAAALTMASPAFADDCHHVAGRDVESVALPFAAPNDPFGRILATIDGTINGVGTAIITSIGPGVGGPPVWTATTKHLFIVNPHDQLAATGAAVITPKPGSFTNANDTVTLTVNGAASTGKFAGATGTIVLKGTGFNFYNPFPFPGPAAGSAYFVFHYEGDVCLADNDAK